jgi:Zn-dependent protease
LKNTYSGLLLLFGKLGPKLFTILAKMQDMLFMLFKSLFGVKSAGIVTSTGLYALLFTWEMGISLMIFLYIHEKGHLWAMDRLGMKHKGMFFIPSLGAAAILESPMQSAKQEAYIAIMGPLWGIVFSLAAALVYIYTHDPLFAAIGAFTAFINLVNLFPIYPLDGGRILKAIAYTADAQTSFAIIVSVSLVAAAVGSTFGMLLIMLMASVGFFEMAKDFGILDKVRNVLHTFFRALFVFFCLVYTGTIKLPRLVTSTSHTSPATETYSDAYVLVMALFILTALVFMIAIVIYDVYQLTLKRKRSIWTYPIGVVLSAVDAVKEVRSLKGHELTAIENYSSMSQSTKTLYAVSYLGLIILHVIGIYLLGQVEGATFAIDLLK